MYKVYRADRVYTVCSVCRVYEVHIGFRVIIQGYVLLQFD